MPIQTREIYDAAKPAIDYGVEYNGKIGALRNKYYKAKSETEKLFEYVYNGKMNLSTKPFEFSYKVSNDEINYFKIDGCIFEKSNRISWSWHPRYHRIYESSFIRNFVPNWKDEYLPNIRYQYRDIFNKVIKFAQTFIANPRISVEKTYNVKPRIFYEYPDRIVQCDEDLTLRISDDSGVELYNEITKRNYNHSTDSPVYYPVIYSYRDQFEDIYSEAEKIFIERTRIAIKQESELKEILTPFLIAKTLFLESYEKRSSR